MVVCLALALLLGVPPDQYDTVALTNGGILRGTVVEDLPDASLVLQMPDGTLRTIPRAEIAGIQYAVPAAYAIPPPEEAVPPQNPAPPPGDPPAFELAVGFGVAFPVGTLDGRGLALASAFSPQATVTFEGSYRPIAELELGLQMLVGGGTSYAPLNDYCLAVGGWCDAFELSLGFFPRWSFLPRGPINPWVMVSGGFEWLSALNDYQDSFDYTGWQVGAAVGFDIRMGPLFGAGALLGTRWGQFGNLSVRGLLPNPGLQPAMHGWIDFSIRGTFGL
jgi:hypothetical protein